MFDKARVLTLIASATFGVLIAIVGCNSQTVDPGATDAEFREILVGDWRVKAENEGVLSFTFKPDSTVHAEGYKEGDDRRSPSMVAGKGTWSIEKGNLIMVIRDRTKTVALKRLSDDELKFGEYPTKRLKQR